MKCPVCNSNRTRRVADMKTLPLSVLALPMQPDSSAARFPVDIHQCLHCGHTFNARYESDFDQCGEGGCTMYNSGADWQIHMQDVAWVIKDLCHESASNGKIIEIGAGRGEFAAMFDHWNYIAYEPSDDATTCSYAVPTCKRFFGPAEMELEKPDAIIMRHVLEHFAYPRDFLEEMALAAHLHEVDPYLIIEVPSILPAFDAGRMEDWVYEHPQHFTPDSLRTLIDLSGWSVTEIETLYNDEVILAIATLDLIGSLDNGKIAAAYENLKRTGMHLKDPVFWGGAGKCANTINMLAVKGSVTVVDSDHRKWGCYVPGTDYEIQSPEILKDLKPERIIVTTTWRTADIAAQIRDLGINTTILNIVDGELQLYEGFNV